MPFFRFSPTMAAPIIGAAAAAVQAFATLVAAQVEGRSVQPAGAATQQQTFAELQIPCDLYVDEAQGRSDCPPIDEQPLELGDAALAGR